MYNKRVLSTAVSELGKAKAPAKKRDNVIAAKRQQTPIVSTEGFKQGPPPLGSKYRIPGDTLYNPTPYSIEAVSDNGIRKTLNPNDTTNVQFPGATYVDESKKEEGGEYYDDELTQEEIDDLIAQGYVVEDLPSAKVSGIPKAQNGKSFGVTQGNYGNTYYVHPDRPDSIYVKENGEWLIKNSSTGFGFEPIKDPKGERTKNLNKNAVKATPFQVARLDNLTPYENQRQRQHVANVAGGMDPKKSEKQLRSSMEKATFDYGFETDDSQMQGNDVANAKQLYDKGLSFHEGWMNSPMYKKMLANSISKDESKIGEQRIKNFNTIPNLLFEKQPKFKPNTGGFSQGSTGQIVILPYGAGVADLAAHEISHSIDRPDYDKSDQRLIPQADINYIQNATPTYTQSPEFESLDNERKQTILNDKDSLREQQEWIDYVSEPTEVRARLNAIRGTAKESGTYDPYTQEVTPEIYKLLQNMNYGTEEKEGFHPLNQLKDLYTDEQIMEMLNTISKNDNSSGDQLNMAKKGGSLLTKKVTCKKCGWDWDAADGGDDITTCHKCGGQGLVHAQKGGLPKAQFGMFDKWKKKNVDEPIQNAEPTPGVQQIPEVEASASDAKRKLHVKLIDKANALARTVEGRRVWGEEGPGNWSPDELKKYIGNVKEFNKEAQKYERDRRLVQEGKLSTDVFAQRFRDGDWARFDENTGKENYKGEYKNAVDEANERKEKNFEAVKEGALELSGFRSAQRIQDDPLGTLEGVAQTGADALMLPFAVNEGAYNYFTGNGFDMGNNPLTGTSYGEGFNEAMDVVSVLPIFAGARTVANPLVKSTVKALGTESGLLSKAYKVNPLAFKSNPNAAYRMLGEEGFQDAMNSGLIRSNPAPIVDPVTGAVTGSRGMQRSAVTFSKGEILPQYKGPYMVEVSDLNKFTNSPVVLKPKNFRTGDINLPAFADDTKYYKQHWLQGYKPVSTKAASSLSSQGLVDDAMKATYAEQAAKITQEGTPQLGDLRPETIRTAPEGALDAETFGYKVLDPDKYEALVQQIGPENIKEYKTYAGFEDLGYDSPEKMIAAQFENFDFGSDFAKNWALNDPEAFQNFTSAFKNAQAKNNSSISGLSSKVVEADRMTNNIHKEFYAKHNTSKDEINNILWGNSNTNSPEYQWAKKMQEGADDYVTNHPDIEKIRTLNQEYNTGMKAFDDESKRLQQIRDDNEFGRDFKDAVDPVFLEKIGKLYEEVTGVPFDASKWRSGLEDVSQGLNNSKLVYADKLSESYQNLSTRAKDYLLKDIDKIGGVRIKGNETMTLGSKIRSEQIQKLTSEEGIDEFIKVFNEDLIDPDYIMGVASHESGHVLQDIYRWADLLMELKPEYNYYITKDTNPLARAFKEAMVEPTLAPKEINPATGVIDEGSEVGRHTSESWTSSVIELHSEMMKARMKKARILMQEDPSLTVKGVIAKIKKLEAKGDKDLFNFYLKEGDLNKHFKGTTPTKIKTKLLKVLPVGIGVAMVGSTMNANAGTEEQPIEGFKKGGATGKKYSRSLEAKNQLYAESKLTKKRKPKNKKIFSPTSNYFQIGGIPDLPLNENRQVLRDWTYGESIGMLQEEDGGIAYAQTGLNLQGIRTAPVKTAPAPKKEVPVQRVPVAQSTPLNLQGIRTAPPVVRTTPKKEVPKKEEPKKEYVKPRPVAPQIAPLAMMDQVFDKFQQAPTPKKTLPKKTSGLDMMHQIHEMYNTKIADAKDLRPKSKEEQRRETSPLEVFTGINDLFKSYTTADQREQETPSPLDMFGHVNDAFNQAANKRSNRVPKRQGSPLDMFGFPEYGNQDYQPYEFPLAPGFSADPTRGTTGQPIEGGLGSFITNTGILGQIDHEKLARDIKREENRPKYKNRNVDSDSWLDNIGDAITDTGEELFDMGADAGEWILDTGTAAIDEIGHWKNMGKRYLQKKGWIDIEEEKIDPNRARKIQPKIKETPKVDKFYQEIATVKDEGYSDNDLLSYRSQWDNNEGFIYIATPTRGDRTNKEEYKNVKGVGHFLLDASAVPGKEYQHEYNAAFLRKAKENNDWIPTFTPVSGNKVRLKYKKPNEITKEDKVVAPLRQFKFDNIMFDNTRRPEGFEDPIKEVLTKDNQGTYLLFKSKDGYSRFSGGSVVFIFKDKYGNTIVRDFAGTLNNIKDEGKAIKEQYELKDNDLTIGYHDVGSFSAKPKADSSGVLKSSQWYDFNDAPMTGGALLIPNQ